MFTNVVLNLVTVGLDRAVVERSKGVDVLVPIARISCRYFMLSKSFWSVPIRLDIADFIREWASGSLDLHIGGRLVEYGPRHPIYLWPEDGP